MSTSNHTASPWYTKPVGGDHGQHLIISEINGDTVAVVYNDNADRHLIAAAPDLLEACQNVHRVISRDSGQLSPETASKLFSRLTEVLAEVEAETKIINGPGELRASSVQRWQYEDVLANVTRLDATLNQIRAILWPDGDKEHQWSADTLEGIAAVFEAQSADHDAEFGMKGGAS